MTKLVSINDYPMSALRNNQSGEVVVRFDVDVNGKAKACRAVQSAGDALDGATCKAIGRGTYQTAVDADGAPVEAPMLMNVNWRLYDQ